MTLTEGLLIVIVIVLTILVLTNCRSSDSATLTRTWDCVDRSSGEITSVKVQHADTSAKQSPEKTALKENAEFFTAQSVGSDSLNYQCDDNGTFPYATDAYGAPGLSYKDYITGQSVDPQVIANHKSFVKDRLTNNNQNITGSTMAMGTIEAPEAIPWTGLRRPQAIPASAMAGSLQVPDTDTGSYAQKAKFTWSSS